MLMDLSESPGRIFKLQNPAPPENLLSRSEVPAVCIHAFVMIFRWLWCPWRLRATKFEPTMVIKYLNYIISFNLKKISLKVLSRINRQQRFHWTMQLRGKRLLRFCQGSREWCSGRNFKNGGRSTLPDA